VTINKKKLMVVLDQEIFFTAEELGKKLDLMRMNF